MIDQQFSQPIENMTADIGTENLSSPNFATVQSSPYYTIPANITREQYFPSYNTPSTHTVLPPQHAINESPHPHYNVSKDTMESFVKPLQQIFSTTYNVSTQQVISPCSRGLHR